jgi:AcrR family transcriptional regulator
MPAKKPKYHHGDLRAALIKAADELIAEGGLETFSLRAAALRAGVSAAAPAHHFGSAKGLLTEVALLAYGRAGRYLDEIAPTGDAVRDMRAVALAFVTFALEHAGHFRLMFRNDLVDREDPRYEEAAHRPGERIGRVVAAYQGRAAIDPERFEDAADLFGALATMHGLAHMVLAKKGISLFEAGTPREFVERELPKVLERLYPERERGKR